MGAKNSIKAVWIDQNINNQENKNYKIKLSRIIGLSIKPYDNTINALEYLKSLKFNPVFIIISGRLYTEFIIYFKNNINKFIICPTIIIFTSNKKQFYEYNRNNKLDIVDHPFYTHYVADSYNDLKESILSTNNELYQLKDVFPLLFKKIIKISSENEEKIINIDYTKQEIEKEEIQLNFEYVPDRNHLILPLFMSDFTKDITEDEIDKFNKYLINKYTNKEIIKLITQLIRNKQVPVEIISKFWVRAYTAQSEFYKDMNKELRENKISKYLTYILVMYKAVNLNSFSFNPSDGKLYRGTFFSKEEIERLKDYINKKKRRYLPAAIIYSRSFFSFSLNPSVAERFEKNVTLIINDFRDEVKGMASISEFSFFENESEILVFPLSCFEIKNIEDRDGNKYYINLDYLDKYEKLFEGEKMKDPVNLIPKDSLLTNQILSSNILDESYQNEISGNYINLKYKVSAKGKKIRIF